MKHNRLCGDCVHFVRTIVVCGGSYGSCRCEEYRLNVREIRLVKHRSYHVKAGSFACPFFKSKNNQVHAVLDSLTVSNTAF